MGSMPYLGNSGVDEYVPFASCMYVLYMMYMRAWRLEIWLLLLSPKVNHKETELHPKKYNLCGFR